MPPLPDARERLRVAAEQVRSAAATHRRRTGFPPLPSPEILLTLFVLGTVLSISPVGQHIDRLFNLRPITRSDGWSYEFLHEVLDRLSSQRVVGVALLLFATWLTWRRRTVAPLIIASLAEAMFFATGIVKALLNKNATKLGDPAWWDDGLLAHGKFSMAYPSGHATESVLLFGAILLLAVVYTPLASRMWRFRTAKRIWEILIVQTVVVSWLLGRHWVSDLAGGLVFGMFGLTLLVGLTERGYPQAVADLCRPWIVGIGRTVTKGPAPRPAQPVIDPPRIPPEQIYRSWVR